MKRALKLFFVAIVILLFSLTIGMTFSVFAMFLASYSQDEIKFAGWGVGLGCLFIGCFSWRNFAQALGFTEFQTNVKEGGQ